jgi:hypothetical protein
MSNPAMLDELLEPFALCLDAESTRRVAEFQVSPAVQRRVDELAEKANEGRLSGQERTDYETLINAADFLALLSLKARRRLTSNSD